MYLFGKENLSYPLWSCLSVFLLRPHDLECLRPPYVNLCWLMIKDIFSPKYYIVNIFLWGFLCQSAEWNGKIKVMSYFCFPCWVGKQNFKSLLVDLQPSVPPMLEGRSYRKGKVNSGLAGVWHSSLIVCVMSFVSWLCCPYPVFLLL